MQRRLRGAQGLVLALVLSAGATQAQISPSFDFLGHVASVPTQNGDPIELLAIINNNGVTPTPIPMDFTSAQHTVVLRGTLDSTSGFTQLYGGTTVEIYTDAGPSTPADYDDPSTFEDGELILSGVFNGSLNRDRYTASLGSFLGNVSWTGGARRDELGLNTAHWSFGGGLSSTSSTIPPGFVEAWDGLIGQLVVSVESQTWSQVKALYRR